MKSRSKIALSLCGIITLFLMVYVGYQLSPEGKAQRVFSALKRNHARWELAKQRKASARSVEGRRELKRVENKIEAEGLKLLLELGGMWCQCDKLHSDFDDHQSDCRWVKELREVGIR